MLKRLTLAALLLSPATVLAAPAASQPPEAVPAEPVSLAPRFAQGDRLEYQYEYRSTVGRTGSDAVAGVTQRGTLRFTVLGVDDSGAAAMTLVFAGLQIDPDAAPDEQEAARQRAEEIAAAMNDAVIRLDVRADGTVSALTGLEAVHDVVARLGRQAWPLLGPFAGEYAAESLADLFRVDTSGPDGAPARHTGDSWSIVSERPLAQSTVLRARTTWSLEALSGQTASLHAQIERTMASTESSNPAAATLAIADQSGAVTASWDVAAGRLIERSAESELDVRATVGDLQGPVVRASTTLQVRSVEPAESEQAAAGVAAP